MHQRCEVDHLHQHADGDMILPEMSDGTRGQADQSGTQLLSLALQRVARMLGDLRLELVHFLDHSCRYLLQKL